MVGEQTDGEVLDGALASALAHDEEDQSWVVCRKPEGKRGGKEMGGRGQVEE